MALVREYHSQVERNVLLTTQRKAFSLNRAYLQNLQTCKETSVWQPQGDVRRCGLSARED